MQTRLVHVTFVVPDYESALDFFLNVLDFRLLEDRFVPEQDKRFIVVQPRGGGTSFVLGRASNETQSARVGDQTGGRVAFFLDTDDFDAAYQRLVSHGVPFVRPPSQEPYGKVAVFRDPFGNLWDLLQLSDAKRVDYRLAEPAGDYGKAIM